jgi:hypothetical protein
MQKSVCVGLALAAVLLSLASLPGCSSKAVTTTSFPVPASISLNPSPTASIELGTFIAFTAIPVNDQKQGITTPIIYQSSNPGVVTVAANGLACAGTWDSISNPTICTPGSIGVAQIIATAQGVSSPVTTVYTHAHIDNVTLQAAANQPNGEQIWPCLTANSLAPNQNNVYEAHAFSAGRDITSTVGQFTWAAVNTTVVKLNNGAPGLANMMNGASLNQNLISAGIPGATPVIASITNTSSSPITITSCPVQTIQLTVTGATTTSKTIQAKVFDTTGQELINTPLTWSSSEPGSVSVTTSGVATGSTATGGAANIIASCTPPTCNIGFNNVPPNRSLPIYPDSVVTLTVPNGTTAASGSVYVTSTGCAGIDGCFTAVVPINFPANTLGSTLSLGSAPNSLVFNRQGTKAYLGTDLGINNGGVGLTIVDATTFPASVVQAASAPGHVLAVSPDGNIVLVTDNTNLYVVNVSATSPAVQTYAIPGVTAAAFSPDSLKAFVLAGSTMYVFSKQDHLLPVATAGTSVTFLPQGSFGVVSSSTGVNGFLTCDPAAASQNITTGTPSFLSPLLGTSQILPQDTSPVYHFVGLSVPDIVIISANLTPAGCASTITGTSAAFDLGQGSSFTPTQMLVSQDGTSAYIVSSQLSGIPVFHIQALTNGAVPLTGNAHPVQATLTPDGTLLYVAADDGNVHVVDTRLGSNGVDVQTITFPTNFCLNSVGQPQSFTCKPDMIAVRP